jgi:hypothetical protein
MQNSMYKIKYLLFMSWDWETWCLTQSGGGVIPPPTKKITAWNMGRKFFHCLGAPNNLIRPWVNQYLLIRCTERTEFECCACADLNHYWLASTRVWCCLKITIQITPQDLQLARSVFVCCFWTEALKAADVLNGSHTIKSNRTQLTKSLWR